LIDAETAYHAAPVAGGAPQRRGDSRRDDDRDNGRYSGDRYGGDRHGSYGHGHPKRRKSFLSELFD
jgi:hypothetical protein